MSQAMAKAWRHETQQKSMVDTTAFSQMNKLKKISPGHQNSTWSAKNWSVFQFLPFGNHQFRITKAKFLLDPGVQKSSSIIILDFSSISILHHWWLLLQLIHGNMRRWQIVSIFQVHLFTQSRFGQTRVTILNCFVPELNESLGF